MKSPQTSTSVNAMKPVAASGGSIVANFDVLDDREDAAGPTGARRLNLASVAVWPGRHRCARLCLVERGWAAAVRAAIGGDRAEKRAARSSAAGDRAATGRAQWTLCELRAMARNDDPGRKSQEALPNTA